MLLDDKEVESRLNHIDNLVNQMRSSNPIPDAKQTIDVTKDSMGTFGISKNDKSSSPAGLIPSMPPSVDDLIENINDKINLAHANTGAIQVLNSSIAQLNNRLCEVEDPRDYSRIASDMSRIVNGFTEAKKNQPITNQQVIIYKPLILAESDFTTMQVGD